MSKIPEMSSKQFVGLLKKGGSELRRQGSTDHAIFERTYKGKRYAAPVQMGKKSLDPIYCKRVFKQLKFSDRVIENLLTKKK